MTCTTCGEKNPNNVRYCARCGASLVGGPTFNRGCFIPVLLIVCTLLASWVVFEIARVTDDRFDTRPPVTPTTRFTVPATAPTATAPAR
jgi:hypothetical protein